jgi:parallel beta-helix repeat protein
MSFSFQFDPLKRYALAQVPQPENLNEIVEFFLERAAFKVAQELLLESLEKKFPLENILFYLKKLATLQEKQFFYVNPHRHRLDEIFHQAQAGDFIFIEPGAYEGPFHLHFPLHLISIPHQETLLYSYMGAALEIESCSGGRFFGLDFRYLGSFRNMVAVWVIQSSPHFSHCTFESRGLTGCEVKGKNSQPYFFKNSFHLSFACGLNILEGAGGIYEQNHLTKNGMHGLSIKGKGTAPHFFQNTFEKNQQLGAHLLDHSTPRLSQNRFLRNQLHGIEVKEEADPYFVHNYLKANKELGIHIMERGKGTYLQNRLVHNGLHGIEVKGPGDPILFQQNYCGSNTESGILFQDQAQGILHQNHIVKNALNGIEIRGNHTSPRISENIVYGNKYRGIFAYQEASPEVVRNIVVNNHTGVSGIEVQNYPKSGTPLLKHNCIFGNKQNYERVKKGEGDICEDPQFLQPDRGDFRLHKNSPLNEFPPFLE